MSKNGSQAIADARRRLVHVAHKASGSGPLRGPGRVEGAVVHPPERAPTTAGSGAPASQGTSYGAVLMAIQAKSRRSRALAKSETGKVSRKPIQEARFGRAASFGGR